MWDYPRPPAVVQDSRVVEVFAGAVLVASTKAAIRILETSHPPSFYLPPDSFAFELNVAAGSSHCEWKGRAQYVSLPGTDAPVGWRYLKPYPEFDAYAGFTSFYPALLSCTVDGEAVRPQAGGFYGGWITDDVVGPFKGEPGTSGW